jgi:hypothetical protein
MLSTLKNMSKEMEMNILNHLWEHASYFRDAFTVQDFNLMLKNIKEDHPLLMGTEISEVARHWGIYLQTRAKARVSEYPCKVSREIVDGVIYLTLDIVDVYGEGKARVIITENDKETGYNMKMVVDETANKYADIGGGIARIADKLSLGSHHRIIHKYFYSLGVNVVARDKLK